MFVSLLVTELSLVRQRGALRGRLVLWGLSTIIKSDSFSCRIFQSFPDRPLHTQITSSTLYDSPSFWKSPSTHLPYGPANCKTIFSLPKNHPSLVIQTPLVFIFSLTSKNFLLFFLNVAQVFHKSACRIVLQLGVK